MPSIKAATHRTRDELADAVRELTDADWGRLRKGAAYFANRVIDAEDLLQEAMQRAFDGGRNCPIDLDPVRFLIGAMRSIAHGELEKSRLRPSLVAIANHGSDAGAVDPPDPGLAAEQQHASSGEAAMMKAALLGLFEDDEIAQTILEGMMEGMEGSELRELTDLDERGYQSKRRLIRRRIDKGFPDGWKL